MTDFATPAETSPTRKRSLADVLTVENILWACLILVAIITRFWDLGSRTQHHDESLHTYYSWMWAVGDRTYVHFPLTHGPLLFHLNALVYWIGEHLPFIGVSDATSRFMPALAGVITIWLPWLLRSRRFLGRWGALAVGFMLLISPAMLYYTRYIRHDPYMVLGTLLLAIALFRYFETPQRRWIIIAFVTVAALLANHELVLATFLIMCVVLWGSVLLTQLRVLIPIHIVSLILLGLAAALFKDDPFPPIPWQRPASAALTPGEAWNYVVIFAPAVLAFVAALFLIWLVRDWRKMEVFAGVLVVFSIGWLTWAQRLLPNYPDLDAMPIGQETTYLTTNEFHSALLHHNLVQAVVVVAMVFLLGCALSLRWYLRDKPDSMNGLDYALGDALPNTVGFGLRKMLQDTTGLAIGISAGFITWIVLFTSWFQNPAGIGTGTYETNGTLLYWLGQHDVRRGEQPWFYFIILGFQYEWLGIFVSTVGTILLGWRLLRFIAGRDAHPNLLWQSFTVAWFLGMFLVLSWAGEKMPWLIVHITLPAVLVGGWLINELITGAIRWYQERDRIAAIPDRYGPFALAISLVLLFMGWFFLTARETFGSWNESSGVWIRQVASSALRDWWMQAIPPLAAMFLIAAAVWIIGPRRTMYSTLVAAFAVMSMFQVHAGFRMSFLEGDLAKDTMIYNTIGPDVHQLVDDMHELSYLLYGNNEIHIVVDSCAMQWPQLWYFRDTEFPNAKLGTFVLSGSPDVILTGQGTSEDCWPSEIPGYTSQLYFMRVHEGESATYRKFAIAPELTPGRSAWEFASDPTDLKAVLKSIRNSIEYSLTPEGQQRLFRLVMYRDPAGPQTVWVMRVWVRNDILPQYNEVRYGDTQP